MDRLPEEYRMSQKRQVQDLKEGEMGWTGAIQVDSEGVLYLHKKGEIFREPSSTRSLGRIERKNEGWSLRVGSAIFPIRPRSAIMLSRTCFRVTEIEIIE